jgi:hypothetical protein
MPQKSIRPVDFVDIGFEDAVRLKELSSKPRHREKVFIGVERPTLEGTVSSEATNLELRWGGALEELHKLPAESVKVANADFLFTEYYIVGWKHIVPQAPVNELTEGDLGWRAGTPFIQDTFQTFREATAK